MGQPALHPGLPTPPPSSASHFCCRWGCPPSSDSPCQLGSMFSMSISLPDGTVPPTTITHTVLCGTRHCVPLRKQPVPVPGGGGGCPLSSLLADPTSALCLPQAGSKEPAPCPSGSQLGRWGFFPQAGSVAPTAPEQRGLCSSTADSQGDLPCPAAPFGTPGAAGLEGTTRVPLSSPLSSQLLYLKLILNFLFEETK